MAQQDAANPTVRLTVETDDHPDLSHIGVFQDTPGPADRTIDRHAHGSFQTDDHRYFVAALSAAETGNPDSVEEDCERLETYGDDWVMVGVRAVATVEVASTTQTIRSSGLWGIASDDTAEHFHDTARDELIELAHIMTEMGLDVETPLSGEWADTAFHSGTVVGRIPRD